MNKAAKLIIVIVLTASIVVVAMVKKTQKNTSAPVADANKPPATIQGNLPRLVDLGADKCIPCKMMAPILEELKTTYAGKLQVDFIDVWKNPNEGNKYKISVIPTQIFYDASGNELFRHEGFFAKEDILAKWKEFGVDLGGTK
jgi:thioredoxin 1